MGGLLSRFWDFRLLKRMPTTDRFSIYIGSAIYTSSIPYIIEEFHVSNVVATLGLSLFIEGYAIGPLVSLLSTACVIIENQA